MLRVVDPQTGDFIPALEEAVVQAEQEALRAAQEAQRAQQEAQRAEQETQRANDAEAEVIRLRAVIEQLTKGGNE